MRLKLFPNLATNKNKYPNSQLKFKNLNKKNNTKKINQ